MRAELILIAEAHDEALVRLTPGRLGRLFGARVVEIRLVRSPLVVYPFYVWRAATTGRDIDYLPNSGKIRRALEFSPVERMPAALAFAPGTRRAP